MCVACKETCTTSSQKQTAHHCCHFRFHRRRRQLVQAEMKACDVASSLSSSYSSKASSRSLWIAPLLMQAALIQVVVIASVCGCASGHGTMVDPPPRGTLRGHTIFIKSVVDSRAPSDYWAHFPAASGQSDRPGAGLAAQRAAAGRAGWTPYEPRRAGFQWRAGVCGDVLHGPKLHERGGLFYFGGRVVRTYTEGAVIDVRVAISAHHNGFFELHLCDPAKCPGGALSTECFQSSYDACVQLRRAPNPTCDSGTSHKCAPIDRNFPGRWYLPCSRFDPGDSSVEWFGGTEDASMKFQLPSGVTCTRCVLQWYWAAANSCNPPGVIAYFNGPDRPRNWGSCPGQGDARGGVAREQRTCGGNVFTEEYIQCADVRIVRARGGAGDSGGGNRRTGRRGRGGRRRGRGWRTGRQTVRRVATRGRAPTPRAAGRDRKSR